MFNWKKKYFNKKIRGVECMIEDLIFKRFKTLEIREEIRQEYDNAKSRLAALDEQIKQEKEKPTLEEGEAKRLDDKKVLLEKDIERLENQMKGLDLEVVGTRPSNEYPEGVTGINETLDSLRELLGMLRTYIKTL